MNDKLALSDDLHDFGQTLLSAGVAFERTSNPEPERHNRKNDCVEESSVRMIERTINEDSG